MYNEFQKYAMVKFLTDLRQFNSQRFPISAPLMHPIDEQSKLILLEVLEDRYREKAAIITSQFSAKTSHELIASPMMADAICDRLIPNS